MKFNNEVSEEYRRSVDSAISAILEKGNEGHRETINSLLRGDIEIRVVPLDKIGCSGVTGLIDRRRTNRKISDEPFGFYEALGEVHITFADWTFNVAGQRGIEGTLVHEGLHACDFARIISTFSAAEIEPLNIFDLSLYELEHRAAITSGEYLSLVAKPDYIDEGRQLGLVSVNAEGQPYVNLDGIAARMRDSYGVTSGEQGTMISDMLGIKPKGASNGLLAFLGI